MTVRMSADNMSIYPDYFCLNISHVVADEENFKFDDYISGSLIESY